MSDPEKDRIDTGIDCPDDIAAWSLDNLDKAANCIDYVDEGLTGRFAAHAYFFEVVSHLQSALAGDRSAHKGLFPMWSLDRIESALACCAYVRAGLNHWQTHNLYWMQIVIYVAERLAAGRLNHHEPAPLPKDDHSPGRWT